MNFYPDSKWQRNLANRAARTGITDERIFELPIVSIRPGESLTVRLLPPRFAHDDAPALKQVEHRWPPLEHNRLTVRALCPVKSDPAIFGQDVAASDCPACVAGIETRVSLLVYATSPDGTGGARMIKIKEWRVVRDMADLGAFDFQSGYTVELWRDERGNLRFELRKPCPVSEEDFVLDSDGLHLPKRTVRRDILEDMAGAMSAWMKAGQPVPPPDQHRDLMEHLPGCTLIPIPFGFKGPHLPAWQQTTLDESRDYDYRSLLDDGNIGLKCGQNEAGVVIGLDADQEALKEKLIVRNPKLSETFAVEGRLGRMKWFFRLPANSRPECLSTAKIVQLSRTGEEMECGEWLANGKQGVIWGLHPCGRWYRPNWKPLLTIDPGKLELPPGYRMKLRQERLPTAQEQYRNARYGGKRPAANRETVESALEYIDPDDRGVWFRVGCALKHWGQQTGDLRVAFEVFDSWSRQSHKYDLAGQEKLWNSVGGAGGKTITLGSLFHLAQQNGWEYEHDK